MIGNKLKELRNRKGLTMQKVASDLEISISTYQKYEYSIRDVSTDMLNTLANYFDVSADYLLGRPAAKPPEDPVLALCNAFRLPEQDRAIVAAYLYMTDKDRAELLRLMKKLVENSDTPKDKQIQQIKLVPQAARGGERPGLVEITDEENAKLLSAPLEDFDL